MKRLYREPNPRPSEVASEITRALDAETRAGLAGAGAACCLESLLRAASDVAADGLAALAVPADVTVAPLLHAAQHLREQAERRIAAAGFASRFSDLALNALGTATFEAGAGGSVEVLSLPRAEIERHLAAFHRERQLSRLALVFLAHDFDHVYRYFVSRDLPDFIGGPGVPTMAHASQLRDAVALHCRETAARVAAAGHEETLAEALRGSPEEARSALQGVLADLTEKGLQRVAAGE